MSPTDKISADKKISADNSTDIEIDITNGKKVKINLSIREWLIICLTVAFIAYVKFS